MRVKKERRREEEVIRSGEKERKEMVGTPPTIVERREEREKWGKIKRGGKRGIGGEVKKRRDRRSPPPLAENRCRLQALCLWQRLWLIGRKISALPNMLSYGRTDALLYEEELNWVRIEKLERLIIWQRGELCAGAAIQCCRSYGWLGIL